jgi:hypothetical protein
MWLAAALVLVGQVLAGLYMNWPNTHDTSFLVEVLWSSVRYVAFYVAMLTGLGVLIEKTDQILWRLKTPAEREASN